MKGPSFRCLFLLSILMIMLLPAMSQDNKLCTLGTLPSVILKPGVVCANADGVKILDVIAQLIIDNPGCKVAVISNCDFGKMNQQLSWDRVNQIINYFVEKKGIRQERFIFRYCDGGGDTNTIDFQATEEEGANDVPAPFMPMSKLLKVRLQKCSY